MTASTKWFGKAIMNALGGTLLSETPAFDLLSDTIKIALLNNYTPNQDTHDFFDDVSANEIAPTGDYSAGGATLANKTLAYDAETNTIKFDATDVTWNGTISATHAVIYKYNADSAQATLLGYIDFGGTVSSTNSTFIITFDVAGVLKITVS